MGLALITGASAGLGAEFARLFARDRHSMILVARRRERLDEMKRALEGAFSGVRVYPIAQDLGKPAAGAELFCKVLELGLPPLDFLVNNAGFGNTGWFGEVPLARELELLDLNVRAVAELTHLCLPPMRKRGSGRILMVGSTAGFQPGPYMANYYASKAYVNSFAEALHEELRGSGVTCTLLAPGFTRTEFQQNASLTNESFMKSFGATAASVAEAAYGGLMGGKAIVVPGARNWWMWQALRITPRFVARRLAGMINKSAS